ncbi:MAG: AAA family ATPase [Xanthobacteraceae bacterium]
MRGFIYALTAHTGRGKTAVALLIAYCIAMGRRLGELDVEKGRVLFLAGENPVDVQMRWIAMSQQLDFDRQTIDVMFINQRFKFSKCMDELAEEITAAGGFDLITVDSSFAFFEGDDENSNAQQGEHASRLRKLTEMTGHPAVLVLCHPPKNAPDDNLQPRGGGAYVAEIDGNLTMTLSGMVATLHWQTKIRGPDFAPVNFQLHTVTHQELKTSKGKLIPTVYASALSDIAQEEMQKAEHNEENLLLQALKNEPRGIIQAELTRRLGWTTKAGKPNRQKVSRVVKRLKKAKFIEEQRGRFTLTSKGQKETES